MKRSYRPYQFARDEDNYPLRARVGLFKWPGGYHTKGPFRKTTGRFLMEVSGEMLTSDTNDPDPYELWEDSD
jgi:hypothetical protein